MANVNIKFNNKEYLLSCDEGQEENLIELAKHLDSKYNELKKNLGNIGENKLLLITSIKMVDDYFDLFKKVKSTNNTAIRLIKRGNYNGIISAEIQTKGKGQRANKWISNKGNLFFSIFFVINSKFSLKKIISNQITEKINIKLPNDILIGKKKVCGILQEIIYHNEHKYLIVGIGINIINSPNILNYPTTFLNNYSKKKINKIKIINKIKLNFEKKYKG